MRPTKNHRGLATVVSFALTLGAGLALGACGSSETTKAEPCPAKVDLEVKALDKFRFEPASLEAKAGKFVVKLIEDGSISHTFEIRGADGKAVVDADTKEACATFDLKAGKYTFYCSVSGHEAAGMKGEITVS